MIMDDCLGI